MGAGKSGTGVFFPPNLLMSSIAASAESSAVPSHSSSRPGLLFSSRQQRVSGRWANSPPPASAHAAAEKQPTSTAGSAQLGSPAATAAQACRPWASGPGSTGSMCSSTSLDLTVAAPPQRAEQLQPGCWPAAVPRRSGSPPAPAGAHLAHSPGRLPLLPGSAVGCFGGTGRTVAADADSLAGYGTDVWPDCSKGLPAAMWLDGIMAACPNSAGRMLDASPQQAQQAFGLGEGPPRLFCESFASHDCIMATHLDDHQWGQLSLDTTAPPVQADSSCSLGSASIIPLAGPDLLPFPSSCPATASHFSMDQPSTELPAAAQLKMQQLLSIVEMRQTLEAELVQLLATPWDPCGLDLAAGSPTPCWQCASVFRASIADLLGRPCGPLALPEFENCPHAMGNCGAEVYVCVVDLLIP